MMTPAQRTPKAWQWAVKTDTGYITDPAWTKKGGGRPADCLVRVVVSELPLAARQRRGKA